MTEKPISCAICGRPLGFDDLVCFFDGGAVVLCSPECARTDNRTHLSVRAGQPVRFVVEAIRPVAKRA